MSQNDLLEKLKDIAGESQVRTDEPMSSHTTFRIGGTADYFVMPSSVEELQAIIRLLKKSDMILIGMLNTNTANNKFYIQTKTLKSLSPFRVLFLICHFAFNKFAYTFSNQINQNNRNKEKC